MDQTAEQESSSEATLSAAHQEYERIWNSLTQPSDSYLQREAALSVPPDRRDPYALQRLAMHEKVEEWLTRHTERIDVNLTAFRLKHGIRIEHFEPRPSEAVQRILRIREELEAHQRYPNIDADPSELLAWGAEFARLTHGATQEDLFNADLIWGLVHADIGFLSWPNEGLIFYLGGFYRPTETIPLWIRVHLGLYDDAPTQDKSVGAPSHRHELTSSSLSLTHLEIPSDPFMLIAGRAIYRPDLWSRSANGLPPMFIEGKTSIYVHPGNGIEALTPEQEESTWAQVRTLDDDHYRVLHVALAVCLAEHGGNYSAEKVRLHANRALELLGRKKHKGTYDPDDKLEMVHKIARLNTIWASGPQLIVENGKKKIVGTVSRLLEVAYEAHPALREEGPNYVVLIALGEWARPLLGPGMRQTALLLQDVLKIDPRDGKGLIASRLGLFLCQHWKIRASRGTYERPWPIKTLLDGAGIKIPEHREQRRRLRENFDEGLDLLAKHGITPGWQYVVPEQATPTNAFTPWLNESTVVISPPSAILEKYKEIPQSRQRKIANARRRGANPR